MKYVILFILICGCTNVENVDFCYYYNSENLNKTKYQINNALKSHKIENWLEKQSCVNKVEYAGSIKVYPEIKQYKVYFTDGQIKTLNIQNKKYLKWD